MKHRPPDRDPERDERTGKSAAVARVQNQARWVDLQIEQAMQRGDFDDLPGFGKPIPGIGSDHDPDWWVKNLVEREQITGVLPPALQIRKDDADLDDQLDRAGTERDVRRKLEDFNGRVRKAMYQPLGGPPMITQQRDVDEEVDRWRARRVRRIQEQQARLAERDTDDSTRRWWRFRNRRS